MEASEPKNPNERHTGVRKGGVGASEGPVSGKDGLNAPQDLQEFPTARTADADLAGAGNKAARQSWGKCWRREGKQEDARDETW